MMRYIPCMVLFIMVSAVTAFASDTTVADVGAKAFLSLLLIIILLFGLAWGMKRYGPVSRIRKTSGLEILGHVALGAKVHLSLVRIGKSVLLLGVTQNNISMIKDLDNTDFEKTLEALNKPGESQQI